MVLLIFFRTPTSDKPDYREGETIGFYSKDHNRVDEFGFWYNRYNETEILQLLTNLGAEKIAVLRGIKNLVHKESNSQTIYVSWLRRN